MLWAGTGVGKLVLITGNMNAIKYIDILRANSNQSA